MVNKYLRGAGLFVTAVALTVGAKEAIHRWHSGEKARVYDLVTKTLADSAKPVRLYLAGADFNRDGEEDFYITVGPQQRTDPELVLISHKKGSDVEYLSGRTYLAAARRDFNKSHPHAIETADSSAEYEMDREFEAIHKALEFTEDHGWKKAQGTGDKEWDAVLKEIEEQVQPMSLHKAPVDFNRDGFPDFYLLQPMTDRTLVEPYVSRRHGGRIVYLSAPDYKTEVLESHVVGGGFESTEFHQTVRAFLDGVVKDLEKPAPAEKK